MNKTETKIFELLRHRLSTGKRKKISISEISDAAGISRQAFTRYYAEKYRKFLSGEYGLVELLELTDERENVTTLVQLASQLEAMSAENERLVSQKKDFERHLKTSIYSEIMQKDLEIHNADKALRELDKAKLTINEQAIEIKRLRLNTKISSASGSFQSDARSEPLELLSIDSELLEREYATTPSFEEFDSERIEALRASAKKAARLAKRGLDLILFQERYHYSYRDILSAIRSRLTKPSICMRFPVHSPIEIKILLSEWNHIHLPTSLLTTTPPSDANLKANRAFFFKHIPKEEFVSADEAAPPRLTSGLVNVGYITEIADES